MLCGAELSAPLYSVDQDNAQLLDIVMVYGVLQYTMTVLLLMLFCQHNRYLFWVSRTMFGYNIGHLGFRICVCALQQKGNDISWLDAAHSS